MMEYYDYGNNMVKKLMANTKVSFLLVKDLSKPTWPH